MGVTSIKEHNNNIQEISPEEVYIIGEKRGLFSKPKEVQAKVKLQAENLMDIPLVEENYLIKPIIKTGDVVLITAETGVGKSLFSLYLAKLVATGESVDNILFVEKPYRVLFIDTEMRLGQLQNRFAKLMMANSTNRQKIRDNLKHVVLQKQKVELVLSQENDQKTVEDLFNDFDADLIIFDNLSGLLPFGGGNNPKSWGLMFRWLKNLSHNGKTIIIVHHLNKQGEHHGLSKIIFDVDLHISLNKLESDSDIPQTKLEVRFPKKRGVGDKDVNPLTIEFNEVDNGIEVIVHTVNGDKKEKTEQSYVSVEEKRKRKLKDLDVEMLNKARDPNDPKIEFITADMFEGINPKTRTYHFNKLVGLGLLRKEGGNRDAKYYAVPTSIKN